MLTLCGFGGGGWLGLYTGALYKFISIGNGFLYYYGVLTWLDCGRYGGGYRGKFVCGYSGGLGGGCGGGWG